MVVSPCVPLFTVFQFFLFSYVSSRSSLRRGWSAPGLGVQIGELLGQCVVYFRVSLDVFLLIDVLATFLLLFTVRGILTFTGIFSFSIFSMIGYSKKCP